MNTELKYLVRGCVCTLVIILIFYAGYYLVSKNYADKKPVTRSTFNIADLSNDPDVVEGKILFRDNCAACHSIHKTDAHLLNDIDNYVDDKKLMRGLIMNSDSVARSNAYFKKRFKAFGVSMPSLQQLTSNEVDQIIKYLQAEYILNKLKSN